MEDEGTSLAALVRAAARRRPEAPAVVAGERRLSWAELDAAVDRAAAGFAAHGLAAGDRVAVQLPNGLDWLRASLGALRAGLVVVPVNTAYTDPELEYVLGDSGAALLVTAGDRAPIAGVPVCAGPPDADGPVPEVVVDPTAPSFLAYTSGTTGRPRGAILTAAALRANQEQCLAMSPPPVREDDRVLLVLPLFHVYGLNAGFGLVAATGACAVLQETFDPRASLTLMAEEHVTAVPGAPPMFQAWLASADAGNLEDPAHPDAELRRGFAAMRLASSGAAPLPGLDLELRDTATTGSTGGGDREGTDPDDRLEGPGEIWVRGPNLFAGYWPNGTDGPDAEGWLGTGDLAYRDADGDLHLVDRRSDLILVSGFNVYPAEVERVLDTHPAVAESAVIGVPDPRTGSAVRAVVVVVPGEELTFEALQEHAAASLARYKVPTSVHFLASLPHSLTGKVSRARLRELGLTGEGADGDAPAEGVAVAAGE